MQKLDEGINEVEEPVLCSIISPAYNESTNLSKFVRSVSEVMTDYNHEIIVIDDGSNDDTLSTLESLMETYNCLRYISFTRNFGHQNALMAGINASRGDCLVMLDADLQHPPSLIPVMLKKWKSGYRVVQGIRKEETIGLKALSSKWFYQIISRISDIPIKEGASDFRLIDKTIVEHLRLLYRPVFLRGYIPWLGYETHYLEYEPETRYSGKTKYSFARMIRLSLDGVTSQSIFPLKLSRYIGVMISILSFIYMVYAICVHVFTSEAVPGWTSILISILFLGGVQLIFLGVMGEYIGRIFERSHNKPIYQIKKQR